MSLFFAVSLRFASGRHRGTQREADAVFGWILFTQLEMENPYLVVGFPLLSVRHGSAQQSALAMEGALRPLQVVANASSWLAFTCATSPSTLCAAQRSLKAAKHKPLLESEAQQRRGTAPLLQARFASRDRAVQARSQWRAHSALYTNVMFE